MSHLRAEARGAVDVQPRHFWAKRATLRFVPLDPPYAPCGSSSAQAFHSDSQIWLHCFHPARPTEPLHSAPPPLHKSICARLRTSSNSLSFRCCFENEPFQPHQALPSGQVLANPLTDSVSSPSRKKDAGSATNQPPDRLPRAFRNSSAYRGGPKKSNFKRGCRLKVAHSRRTEAFAAAVSWCDPRSSFRCHCNCGTELQS